MAKIKRVFIANRGEISARIATTARRMGIETVAITDRKNPPAFLLPLITEFIQVEDETTATYLNGDQIIAYAIATNCDSIHPGFGFLSENEAFARKVKEAGLIWIGPSHEAIGMLASKATARDLAIASQVPCVNGLQNFHVPIDEKGDFSELENFADKTGYPLLIKAALGGGGKGMRLVRQKSELKEAALRARSEAINSFGDDALIVERYVESPRHIEVQILADKHGNVAAIGDRDCSVQRRHQKILEEAPAPDLSEKTRKSLHESAVNLAKKVGYSSAGTVEFLLDWSKGKSYDDQEYFFLEMNTRLQVEHPVTEEVFGIDLVEWQFRVAQGEMLPEHFKNLKASRHSIEARFYAEDVDGNFFPSPGIVLNFTPHHDLGVRWEIGIDPVDEITSKFDPMVAKIITTGETREVALQKLVDTIKKTVFAGPVNNLEFLMDICSDSPYTRGPVDTHFIDRTYESLQTKRQELREKYGFNAQKLLKKISQCGGNFLANETDTHTINIQSITLSAFSNSIPSSGSYNDIVITKESAIYVDQLKHIKSKSGFGLYKTSDGQLPFSYAVISNRDEKQYWVFIDGRAYNLYVKTSIWEGDTTLHQGEEDISAPVPGKVIKAKAEPQMIVNKGDVLFVLESMKMEFEVKAAKDGTVSEIKVSEGEQVTTGQLLATWE